jgi:hypothetical protein
MLSEDNIVHYGRVLSYIRQLIEWYHWFEKVCPSCYMLTHLFEKAADLTSAKPSWKK